ncbi:hypothetical protein X759_09595 [Mesorhizobium sp. LSHC420B00]|nr:hypothetical protein X759_09595 [Mesorhizobium sp. LSHC420B00]
MLDSGNARVIEFAAAVAGGGSACSRLHARRS